MGEEIRKKAMEGLVSSEYATFFCMALTNMPFDLHFFLLAAFKVA